MNASDIMKCIREIAGKLPSHQTLRIHKIEATKYGCSITSSTSHDPSRTLTEFRRPGVVYRQYEFGI